MTDILGGLEILKLQGGRWELLSNPIILLNSGRTIKPQHGFIYDGGSVPQLFWSLVGGPVGTDADWGYLVHDWLYYLSRQGNPGWTRREADEAMLELHLYCGVPELIAYGVFTAVRGGASEKWGTVPGPASNEDFSWFYE